MRPTFAESGFSSDSSATASSTRTRATAVPVRGANGGAAPGGRRMTSTRVYLAEVVGTFLLVLFGTGAVASAVMAEALNGLW